MSGICGLFNLDGAPATGADLAAMTFLLRRHAPDSDDRWHKGPVGLGHGKKVHLNLETGCAVTADVRLDNRDELIAAVGDIGMSANASDTTLVLLAYLKWGEDCASRLLGDFAFAIWDPRHQKLFCVRDGFGMRPFYYHHARGKRFVFGSNPRSLHVLPQVPHRLNDGRIADFLVPELQWIDYTSTFFEEVF